MRLRKCPDPFPRAPGRRTSGQMARFSLFKNTKPGQPARCRKSMESAMMAPRYRTRRGKVGRRKSLPTFWRSNAKRPNWFGGRSAMAQRSCTDPTSNRPFCSALRSSRRPHQLLARASWPRPSYRPVKVSRDAPLVVVEHGHGALAAPADASGTERSSLQKNRNERLLGFHWLRFTGPPLRCLSIVLTS
jgi:hypothetical protein